MSLMTKIVSAFVPGAFAIPAAQQTGIEIAKVVAEFREKRADDFAEMADRAGRSGARLAATELTLDRWRRYAHDLERLCMQHGVELPVSPDDHVD